MKNKKMARISLLMVFALLTALFVPLGAGAKEQGALHSQFSYGNLRREQISYTRKVDNMYGFNGAFPIFESLDPNGCAPMAAASVLGYYCQSFSDLMSGYQSLGINSNGNYSFASQNAAVNQATAALTTAMGGTQNGVSVSNLKSGLTSYVSGKGFNISYTSVVSTQTFSLLGITLYSWTSFDFGKYVNEINAGRPVVLALSSYHSGNIGTAVDGSLIDVHSYSYPTSKLAHAMVGYGYRTIRYYRNETRTVWSPTILNPFRTVNITEEVNFRNDTFLMASTGQGWLTYLNINHSFEAFDAFSVTITKPAAALTVAAAKTSSAQILSQAKSIAF